MEPYSIPPYPLIDLKQHLENPVFNLYLGRKSCPLALPLQPQVVQLIPFPVHYPLLILKTLLSLPDWNPIVMSEYSGKGMRMRDLPAYILFNAGMIR